MADVLDECDVLSAGVGELLIENEADTLAVAVRLTTAVADAL